MGVQLNFLLVFSLTAIILTIVSVKGHPHECDCSPYYETCLNLTEFGSAGFQLFGKTMTLFEVSQMYIASTCTVMLPHVIPAYKLTCIIASVYNL